MDSREHIINRSIDLFTKSGIRSVTMDQIASYAGISKRTIYEIFKDKNDLLEQCIEEIIKISQIELQQILDKSENSIEALFQIGQHGEKKRSSLNPLFFEDIDKLYPEIKKKFIKRTYPGKDSISFKILNTGIDEGIFRKEMNIEIVDIFIHEIMKICNNAELFPDNTNTLEIVENIVLPFFRGISTTKGKELLDKHFPVVK